MASVVFFRAVNVGSHQRFQPSVLAKQLTEFGVVNVGAAGTFVVRKNVSQEPYARKSCAEYHSSLN